METKTKTFYSNWFNNKPIAKLEIRELETETSKPKKTPKKDKDIVVSFIPELIDENWDASKEERKNELEKIKEKIRNQILQTIQSNYNSNNDSTIERLKEIRDEIFLELLFQTLNCGTPQKYDDSCEANLASARKKIETLEKTILQTPPKAEKKTAAPNTDKKIEKLSEDVNDNDMELFTQALEQAREKIIQEELEKYKSSLQDSGFIKGIDLQKIKETRKKALAVTIKKQDAKKQDNEETIILTPEPQATPTSLELLKKSGINSTSIKKTVIQYSYEDLKSAFSSLKNAIYTQDPPQTKWNNFSAAFKDLNENQQYIFSDLYQKYENLNLTSAYKIYFLELELDVVEKQLDYFEEYRKKEVVNNQKQRNSSFGHSGFQSFFNKIINSQQDKDNNNFWSTRFTYYFPPNVEEDIKNLNKAESRQVEKTIKGQELIPAEQKPSIRPFRSVILEPSAFKEFVKNNNLTLSQAQKIQFELFENLLIKDQKQSHSKPKVILDTGEGKTFLIGLYKKYLEFLKKNQSFLIKGITLEEIEEITEINLANQSVLKNLIAQCAEGEGTDLKGKLIFIDEEFFFDEKQDLGRLVNNGAKVIISGASANLEKLEYEKGRIDSKGTELQNRYTELTTKIESCLERIEKNKEIINSVNQTFPKYARGGKLRKLESFDIEKFSTIIDPQPEEIKTQIEQFKDKHSGVIKVLKEVRGDLFNSSSYKAQAQEIAAALQDAADLKKTVINSFIETIQKDTEQKKILEQGREELTAGKDYKAYINKIKATEIQLIDLRNRREAAAERIAKSKIRYPKDISQNTDFTAQNVPNLIKMMSDSQSSNPKIASETKLPVGGLDETFLEDNQITSQKAQYIFPSFDLGMIEERKAALPLILNNTGADIVLMNAVEKGVHKILCCYKNNTSGKKTAETTIETFGIDEFLKKKHTLENKKCVMVYDKNFAVGGDYGSFSALGKDDKQFIYLGSKQDLNVDIIKQAFGRDRSPNKEAESFFILSNKMKELVDYKVLEISSGFGEGIKLVKQEYLEQLGEEKLQNKINKFLFKKALTLIALDNAKTKEKAEFFEYCKKKIVRKFNLNEQEEKDFRDAVQNCETFQQMRENIPQNFDQKKKNKINKEIERISEYYGEPKKNDIILEKLANNSPESNLQTTDLYNNIDQPRNTETPDSELRPVHLFAESKSDKDYEEENFGNDFDPDELERSIFVEDDDFDLDLELKSQKELAEEQNLGLVDSFLIDEDPNQRLESEVSSVEISRGNPLINTPGNKQDISIDNFSPIRRSSSANSLHSSETPDFSTHNEDGIEMTGLNRVIRKLSFDGTGSQNPNSSTISSPTRESSSLLTPPIEGTKTPKRRSSWFSSLLSAIGMTNEEPESERRSPKSQRSEEYDNVSEEGQVSDEERNKSQLRGVSGNWAEDFYNDDYDLTEDEGSVAPDESSDNNLEIGDDQSTAASEEDENSEVLLKRIKEGNGGQIELLEEVIEPLNLSTALTNVDRNHTNRNSHIPKQKIPRELLSNNNSKRDIYKPPSAFKPSDAKLISNGQENAEQTFGETENESTLQADISGIQNQLSEYFSLRYEEEEKNRLNDLFGVLFENLISGKENKGWSEEVLKNLEAKKDPFAIIFRNVIEQQSFDPNIVKEQLQNLIDAEVVKKELQDGLLDSENQILKLREESEKLTEESEKLTEEKADLTKRLFSNRVDFLENSQEKDKKFKDLSEKKSALEKKLQNLRTDHQRINTVAKKLRSNLANIPESENEISIKKRLKELEQELKYSEESARIAREKYQNQRKIKNSEITRREDVEGENIKLKANLDQQTIDYARLDESLTLKKQELINLESKNNKIIDTARDKKKRLKESEQKIKSFVLQNELLKAGNSRLESERDQAILDLNNEKAQFNSQQQNLQNQIAAINADKAVLETEKNQALANLRQKEKELQDKISQSNISQSEIASLKTQHQSQTETLQKRIFELEQESKILQQKEKVLNNKQEKIVERFVVQQEKNLSAIFNYEKAAEIIFTPKNEEEQRGEIDYYRNKRFAILSKKPNLDFKFKDLKNASEQEIIAEIKKDRLRTISSTLSKLAKEFNDKEFSADKLSPSQISVLMSVVNTEKFQEWQQKNSDKKISHSFSGNLDSKSAENEIRQEAFEIMKKVVKAYGAAFDVEFIDSDRKKKFSDLFIQNIRNVAKPKTEITEAKAADLFSSNFRSKNSKTETIDKDSLLKLPFDFEKAANLVFGAKSEEDQKLLISDYKENRARIYKDKAHLKNASDQEILQEIKNHNCNAIVNSLKSLAEKLQNPLLSTKSLSVSDIQITLSLSNPEKYEAWKKENPQERIDDKFKDAKPDSKEFELLENSFKKMRETLLANDIVHPKKASLDNLVDVNFSKKPNPIVATKGSAAKMLLNAHNQKTRSSQVHNL